MTRVRGAALPRVVAVFALAAVAPLFFSAGGDVLNSMVLAGQDLGWRSAFLVVAVLGVLTAVSIVRAVPSVPADPVRRRQSRPSLRDSLTRDPVGLALTAPARR